MHKNRRQRQSSKGWCVGYQGLFQKPQVVWLPEPMMFEAAQVGPERILGSSWNSWFPGDNGEELEKVHVEQQCGHMYNSESNGEC